MSNLPVFGVILGDHAGIGPEIVIKALLQGDSSYIPLLIGSRKHFEKSLGIVKGSGRIKILPSDGRPDKAIADTVYFYDVEAGDDIQFSKINADSGKLILNSIVSAIDLEKSGVVDGIFMAPITKQALHAAGHGYSSENEIFKEQYG